MIHTFITMGSGIGISSSPRPRREAQTSDRNGTLGPTETGRTVGWEKVAGGTRTVQGSKCQGLVSQGPRALGPERWASETPSVTGGPQRLLLLGMNIGLAMCLPEGRGLASHAGGKAAVSLGVPRAQCGCKPTPSFPSGDKQAGFAPVFGRHHCPWS